MLSNSVRLNYRKTLFVVQFNSESRRTKNTFEEAAFCIAKVSNIYVLSAISWYIISSSFKYEHVQFVCSGIDYDSIEVISYDDTIH